MGKMGYWQKGQMAKIGLTLQKNVVIHLSCEYPNISGVSNQAAEASKVTNISDNRQL